MKTKSIFCASTMFFLMLALFDSKVCAQESNDIPSALTDIRLFDNGDGSVTLSWLPANSIGQNGGFVNIDEVTYNIYNRYYEPIVNGLKDTSYTFYNIEQPEQLYMLLYRMTAENSKGESEMVRSNFILLGPSLLLPYGETAPEGKPQQEWWTEQHADEPFQGSTAGSSDDDGGCTAWYSAKAGEDATSSSAKISLQGTDNPVLFFSYYTLPGQDIEFDVVVNRAGREDQTMATISFLNESGASRWRNMTIDLKEMLSDNYIVLRFKARNNANKAITLLIDNIRIYDQPENDLAIRLTAPGKWVAGNEMALKVGLTNYGSHSVEQSKVKLLVNSEIVSETVVEDEVAKGEEKVLMLSYTPSITLPSTIEMRAEVELSNDDNMQNNVSNTFIIDIAKVNLPAVDNLLASDSNGNAMLEWTIPTQAIAETNDSFEDYGLWSIDNIGAWTTFDGDGMQTFGIQGVDFPNEVMPKAFVVVDPSAMTYDEFYVDMPPAEDPLFVPHTGNQYLISFNPDTYYDAKATADDWLISPRLSGEAQTVSFWAHSFDEYAKEKVQIMISSTDKEAESFVVLKTIDAVDIDWTHYEAQLPEGTQYFAIRVVSHDKWALFLDDVTFVAASPKVRGCNIYRDGNQIAFVEVPATSFVDTEADAGSHDYQVSVLYEDGESALSNVATFMVTAANDLSTDNRMFDVFTIDGMKVRRNATSLKGLRPGVYIVNGKKIIL